jgi:hypothetical protein
MRDRTQTTSHEAIASALTTLAQAIASKHLIEAIATIPLTKYVACYKFLSSLS